MRPLGLIAAVGILASLAAACSGSPGGQGTAVRHIGIFMPVTAEDPTGQERESVFLEAMAERGWVEGRNLKIDRRSTKFDRDEAQQHVQTLQYASELVALAPDVILAGGGGVVAELKQATHTIPIVFTAAIDPVARGYVDSVRRPAGNITGFINIDYDFASKYLELLKEIAPDITRVGVLRTPGFPRMFAVINALAPSLGVTATPIDMSDAGEIERAITAFSEETGAGGLIVTASTQATRYSSLIIALAARHKLPTVYPNRLHVAAGGLVSYGPFFLDQYRRAAEYVDRILRGEKPGELPVQAPLKYDTALNMETAGTLGLHVPRVVLVRAIVLR